MSSASPLRAGAAATGLALVLGVLSASSSAQQRAPEFVPGEVLVQYRAGVGEGRRANARARHRARALRRMDALNVEHLRVPTDLDVPATVRALRLDADVVDAQPNYIRYIAPAAPPNDPFWVNGNLWGHERISAQSAWNAFGPGNTTVVVADIDTGVKYDHPDLAANMWRNPGEVAGNGVDDDGNGYVDDVYGIDPHNGDANPMDDHGHGTHTAGTFGAVANNSTGLVGVSQNVKILACKMMGANGSGEDSSAIACFNYIVTMKNRGVNIRVSNNSWGSARTGINTLLRNAIDAAGNAGIINVFAAGNDGTNNDTAPFDPASYTSSSIVSVAASDQSDNRASFSNYGASSVDLAAPGVGVLSTVGSGYASWNGTSMAAPHVAGAAAMMFAHSPSATVSEVKQALLATVDPLAQWSGLVASAGRLNLYGAVANVRVGASPTVAITAPASGAQFTAPASVAISATASDSDGTVSKVDFFSAGTLIGSDTSSPYQVTWSNVAAGSYSLTAVATDNSGATATSPAVAIQVNPGSGGGGAAATFVRADTTTQGNWRGVYGAEGYAVVGDGTSYPAYATVTTAGQSSWTWNGSPDETRALQRPGGGRVAATWYASTTFSIDVNLSDGQLHQVALYLLDWDSTSRAERIEVVDAGSGLVLDSRDATSFAGGQYLAWSVRGHVRVNVVRTAGVNAVVSGIFLDAVTNPGAPQVSLTSPTSGQTFSAPASIALAATASDGDGIQKVDFYANGSLVGTDTSSPYAAAWSNVAAGSYSLTAVATDGGGATATSAAVSVTVNAAGGSAAASFVRSDTTTQGNWRGVYGGEGFAVLGDSTSYPTYAAVAPSGQLPWTWTSSTSDARALQRATSGRVAATWYSGSSFSVDVNLTDGQVHQVAMYLLDWDGPGRAERIDVTDAGSGQLLDSRSASSFVAGQYLVWSIRGHVRFTIVRTGGVNAVLSGLFFDAAANPGAPQVSLTSPANGQTFITPASISLAADASGSSGIQKVEFFANGTLVGGDTSSPYSGTWTGVPAGTYSLTAVATDSAGVSATSAAVNVTVSAAGGGATATFVRIDTATQGNWHGVYGGEGYAVLGDTTAYPAYASVTPSGQAFWTWTASTGESRALRRVGSGRVAATWYAGTSFSVDVNLSDGQPHQLAVYLLDWDSGARAQRIDVVDAASGVVLDTRSASSFNGGQYLVWTVRGHVRLQVTRTAGVNAVIGGLFFGPPATAPAAVLASDKRLRLDLVTTAPTHVNLTSPVRAGGQLLIADQTGYLYRWDGAALSTLLTPATLPSTIVPVGNETLLNVASDAGGSSVYAMFTSATAPPAVPQRLSPRPGADAWQVLYRFAFNGSVLSNPQPITALQVRSDGHTGGGLAVLEGGDVLFAAGDHGDAGEDGGTYAQDVTTHLSKLLRIDPGSGGVTVVATGLRNVQRLTLTGSGASATVEFADMGGKIAEELNAIKVQQLTGAVVHNFGWGRHADGRAREGTFYIDAAGNVAGSAPAPENGFLQPIAQFGREGAPFIAMSGPVQSALSFTTITSVFGDLVSGRVYATLQPSTVIAQPVYVVNLIDDAGQPLTLTALTAGQRPDPRFFTFADGTAGVVLEATGALYRISELAP